MPRDFYFVTTLVFAKYRIEWVKSRSSQNLRPKEVSFHLMRHLYFDLILTLITLLQKTMFLWYIIEAFLEGTYIFKRPTSRSTPSCLQVSDHNLLAGISPEALFKGGGYPASHPGHDLLLERERQIAQERDRALR